MDDLDHYILGRQNFAAACRKEIKLPLVRELDDRMKDNWISPFESQSNTCLLQSLF